MKSSVDQNPPTQLAPWLLKSNLKPFKKNLNKGIGVSIMRFNVLDLNSYF